MESAVRSCGEIGSSLWDGSGELVVCWLGGRFSYEIFVVAHGYALGPIASKASLNFAADLLCDDVLRAGDELFVLMHQLFEDRPIRCIVRDFLGVR